MNIKELRKITSTDKFTEMPLSTQALYFHLAVNADENDFICNPKAIQRAVNSGLEDLGMLRNSDYIINNDDYGITLNN